MKEQLSKIMQIIISAIISLLGFSTSSCYVMYGSPTADYQAEGYVTDEDGKPIEGIRIQVTLEDDYTDDNEGFIVYSDSEGRFSTTKYKDWRIQSLTATDIDGEKNGGEFENTTIDLRKMQLDLNPSNKKKDDWYLGVYIYRNVQIVLTPKYDEPEQK